MKQRSLTLIPLTVLLTGAAACRPPQQPVAEQAIAREILWDTWGVPHLYGSTLDDAFYLFGWAQARAHANTLAVAYGRSSGRAAEHWGESFASSDVLIRQMRLPERSTEWLAQHNAAYRGYIAAFARGINDYIAANPQALATQNRWVFPVEPPLVLLHAQRMLMDFLMHGHDGPAIDAYAQRLTQQRSSRHTAGITPPAGSNAYAIAPQKSASGNAMLVINPHLPWGDEFQYFEAHIAAAGIDAYGVTLIGLPYLSAAFTPTLGWAHTVNPADGADTYELTLQDDGYLFDGKVLPFERAPDEIVKVRGADGKIVERPIEIRASVQGPVVFYDAAAGKALALRMTGLDRDDRIERYWSLIRARNLQEFQAITEQYALPFFNTVYADRDGNILFQYNAQHPDRSGSYRDWLGIQQGDRAATLWTRTLPITQMPGLVNPATGFVQNSNDPPWSATFPFQLDPAGFASALPPPNMDFRTQSITKMLLAQPKLTFEELLRQKNSNRIELADRVLPDLLEASANSADPLVRQARQVLAAWDRHVNPSSRGAIPFLRWVDAMGGWNGDWFAASWSHQDPLATPRGLKSPQTAVQTLARISKEVIDAHGALDVPFGDVYRMRLGNKDVPARVASVYYGLSADGGFRRAADGKYAIKSGDSFIAVVEYSTPLRAEGLLTYGNSSQPDSPHVGDQLELFSQGKLRPFWRERSEIERHLELRETPNR